MNFCLESIETFLLTHKGPREAGGDEGVRRRRLVVAALEGWLWVYEMRAWRCQCS